MDPTSDRRDEDRHPVDVLRVFVGPDDRGGNPLGVVLDGSLVPRDRRQALAAALGYSETVIVDDTASGRLQIFTPAAELPFAGHPLVGTGWLLRRRGLLGPGQVLRPPAGEVPTWTGIDGLTWVRGRAAWVSPMSVQQLDSAADVDAVNPADVSDDRHVWAWLDEPAGKVRARMFAPALGIEEDEATGAAAVKLTDQLRRPLTIHQGKGSVLRTSPGPDGTVDLGGAVVPAGSRELPPLN